jgi:hypothetical protein
MAFHLRNVIVFGGRDSASSSGVAEVCCERTDELVDDGEGEQEGDPGEIGGAEDEEGGGRSGEDIEREKRKK